MAAPPSSPRCAWRPVAWGVGAVGLSGNDRLALVECAANVIHAEVPNVCILWIEVAVVAGGRFDLLGLKGNKNICSPNSPSNVADYYSVITILLRLLNYFSIRLLAVLVATHVINHGILH